MKTDRAEGEGRGAALVVRDGLLECPNCGGDHFTTLRLPQKKLFSSALARLGRAGLVLTDLPAFIVASSADRQLAPAPAPRPSGRADGIGKIRIGFEDNQSATAAEGASVKDAIRRGNPDGINDISVSQQMICLRCNTPNKRQRCWGY